jgi:hypothetical protein
VTTNTVNTFLELTPDTEAVMESAKKLEPKSSTANTMKEDKDKDKAKKKVECNFCYCHFKSLINKEEHERVNCQQKPDIALVCRTPTTYHLFTNKFDLLLLSMLVLPVLKVVCIGSVPKGLGLVTLSTAPLLHWSLGVQCNERHQRRIIC